MYILTWTGSKSLYWITIKWLIRSIGFFLITVSLCVIYSLRESWILIYFQQEHHRILSLFLKNKLSWIGSKPSPKKTKNKPRESRVAHERHIICSQTAWEKPLFTVTPNQTFLIIPMFQSWRTAEADNKYNQTKHTHRPVLVVSSSNYPLRVLQTCLDVAVLPTSTEQKEWAVESLGCCWLGACAHREHNADGVLHVLWAVRIGTLVSGILTEPGW